MPHLGLLHQPRTLLNKIPPGNFLFGGNGDIVLEVHVGVLFGGGGGTGGGGGCIPGSAEGPLAKECCVTFSMLPIGKLIFDGIAFMPSAIEENGR